MAEQLRLRFGRYELLQRLSVGRVAEVFRARVAGAAGVEKTVAIKRILGSLSDDEGFIRSFIQEAKISTRLTHPNVGQVYEFGVIEGQYYLAMEYVHGRDLLAILQHFRRLGATIPLPVAIRIVLELCKALDYAHNQKDAAGKPLELIHRDVSPPNVIISYDGAVKLIDFGVARALACHRETATGPLTARCVYLSPEQASGAAVDRRSDLFALGTVFFEMVTGRAPFLGDTDMATLARLRRAELTRPSRLNPALPGAVEAVILKALAREPDRRFPRADAMHDLLEGVASGEGLSLSTLQLARWMTGTFPADDLQEVSLGEMSFDELTGSDEDTVPGTISRELAALARGSSGMARAAAFAADRPAPPAGAVDFSAMDFDLDGDPTRSDEVSAELASDDDLELQSSSRAAADPSLDFPQLAAPEKTQPTTSPEEASRPLAVDDSYAEFSVEMPLEDDEPTRPMVEPGWDELATSRHQPGAPLDAQMTRPLLARSSSGAVFFEPGPLEDPAAPADQTSVDEPLPLASTAEALRLDLPSPAAAAAASHSRQAATETVVADVEDLVEPRPPRPKR